MEKANVISKLNKVANLNIIKKAENKYGKLSYKDAIKSNSIILLETHDQKWYDTRIKSPETELARKDDIIHMSKIFS